MSMSPESELGEKMAKSAVIAVLVIDAIDDAVPVAKALLEGGVELMELTLRTDAALPALRQISQEVPEMIAGIGTILRPDQVDAVAEAGADFGVAPGTNRRVIRQAKDRELPFAPGIMTPTDIEMALQEDCRIFKYFPANTSGGLPHLKNIAAPFQHLGIGFIPLGGVNDSNMSEYLESPIVSAVGGSWLASREAIQARDWAEITRRAEKAREIVDSIRP